MVKFLIVTHGPLAGALKESARMFFSEQVDCIDTIGLFPGDSVEELKEKIASSIQTRYTEEGIMIFVDILSGSPFNSVAMVMNDISQEYPKIECFTGVNLPILMEVLAQAETMPLEEMKKTIEELAPTSIVDVKKALGLE